MSHVFTINHKILNLEAVEAACKRLGWTLKRGQTSYRWFGQWMGDSPIPEHLFTSDELATIKDMTHNARSAFLSDFLGRCEHAIEVPGARYEIGLLAHCGTYVPVWDNWQSGGLQGITPENGMAGFIQAYILEAARLQAQAEGRVYQEEVLQDGTIKARIIAH
jgi:hypothetical protein